MIDPQAASIALEETFRRIEGEQMKGIPLLNPMLRVETLGFQEHEGRVFGIVITPWLMNLVMLPRDGEDWEGCQLGDKETHRFPSGSYRFMVNEYDGIGRCQTHSLYSPMGEFLNQDHAVAAAQGFLDTLMVEREQTEEDRVDEELLGRILRGEERPELDPAALAEIEAIEGERGCRAAQVAPDVAMAAQLSRRDLLRGGFLKGG